MPPPCAAFAGLHVPLVAGGGRTGAQRARRPSPRACAPPPPARFSRRDALTLFAAAAAAPAVLPLLRPHLARAAAAADGAAADGAAASPRAPAPLALPALPYQYNALEPAIDRETMALHHDKHFAKYTEGANAALAKIPGAAAAVDGDPAKLADLLGDLESIKDEAVRGALRNNGGGYVRLIFRPPGA